MIGLGEKLSPINNEFFLIEECERSRIRLTLGTDKIVNSFCTPAPINAPVYGRPFGTERAWLWS